MISELPAGRKASGYNNDNTLAGISFTSSLTMGASIGDLGYTWDVNKNKTSETIGGLMSGYGFKGSGLFDVGFRESNSLSASRTDGRLQSQATCNQLNPAFVAQRFLLMVCSCSVWASQQSNRSHFPKQ